MTIESCLKFYAVPSPSKYMALIKVKVTDFEFFVLNFTVSVFAMPLIDLNHV